MHRRLLDLLVCPECQEPVRLVDEQSNSEGEVEEGKLLCPKCESVYVIQRWVPRLVDSDAYTAPFSFEWQIHRQTQFGPESGSREQFIGKMGIKPEELSGKLVLDAGCGAGRYTQVLADRGVEVVALDLSESVDVAQENVGRRGNVHVVQGSIGAMPFRPDTFDFICGFGVLQHSHDPRGLFRALTRVLKPGGEVGIAVCSAHDRSAYWASDLLRPITTRLPRPFLYRLCHVAIPLYHLYNSTRLRPLLSRLLPISMSTNPEERLLDTFNLYAPKYQFKHTYPEVFNWFREAGVDCVFVGIPVSMRGRLMGNAEKVDQGRDRDAIAHE